MLCRTSFRRLNRAASFLSQISLKSHVSALSLSLSRNKICERNFSSNAAFTSLLFSDAEVEAMASAVCAGDRLALSRAITLVESTRYDHRRQSNALLMHCLSHSLARPTTSKPRIRIGISGPPGVGKSTLIEAFGCYLIDKHDLSVAVLSVDPSSSVSGGSILGDKTRMTELSRRPDKAFVRPSPSSCTLGGVARDTAEAAILCEAAGYDVVIVETVGVGQSEIAVTDVVDMTILLVAPAGGDELQGMKKGVVECAQLVLVNKCDGALAATARATKCDYMQALQLAQGSLDTSKPHWRPTVHMVSAITPDAPEPVASDSKESGEQRRRRDEITSLAGVWQRVLDYYELMTSSGQLNTRRAAQRRTWMKSQMREELADTLKRRTEERRDLQDAIKKFTDALDHDFVTPRFAATSIIEAFTKTYETRSQKPQQ